MTPKCQPEKAVSVVKLRQLPQLAESYDVTGIARLYSGGVSKRSGQKERTGARELWDGDRIREVRKARGLSREQLEVASDVNADDIGRHERNDKASNPSVETLLKISRALRVAPGVLFEPVGSPIPSPKEFGHATVDAESGGARIEDRLGDLLAYIKTLEGNARGDFIRAVIALLNALEHARPHAAGGATENDGR